MTRNSLRHLVGLTVLAVGSLVWLGAAASPVWACSLVGYGDIEDAVQADSFSPSSAIVVGRYVERRPARARDQWVVEIEVETVIKGQVDERVVGRSWRSRGGGTCGGLGDTPPGSDGIFVLDYDQGDRLIWVNGGWAIEDLARLDPAMIPYPGEDLRGARDVPALPGPSWLPEVIARHLLAFAIGLVVALGAFTVGRRARRRRRGQGAHGPGPCDVVAVRHDQP